MRTPSLWTTVRDPAPARGTLGVHLSRPLPAARRGLQLPESLAQDRLRGRSRAVRESHEVSRGTSRRASAGHRDALARVIGQSATNLPSVVSSSWPGRHPSIDVFALFMVAEKAGTRDDRPPMFQLIPADIDPSSNL